MQETRPLARPASQFAMETRPLGQTGLSITSIGLGGGGLPNDDKTSAEVTHAFLKAASTVDTSPVLWW